MRILLAALTSILFFTACDFDQNPVKDASDPVKNGKPPEMAKPEPAKPLPSDALQIDAPEKVNGRVGVAISFKITGRVLVPGIDYTLSVENLADFEGATFDSTTGEFKWTPTKAVVVGFPEVDLNLKVRLATVKTSTSVVSVEDKNIQLNVKNEYSKPIINSITTQSSAYITGTDFEIPFVMEDIDSLGDKDIKIAIRDCSTSYYYKSIAHFVKLSRLTADPKNPGKFNGVLKLALTDASLVPTGKYCFALEATSKFGVPSDIYQKELAIESRLRETRITTDDVIRMTQGEVRAISFSIYDPSGAGKVTFQKMTDIAAALPGSKIQCAGSFNNISQVDCEGVIVTTATTEAKAYWLTIDVQNELPGTIQKRVNQHTVKFQVQKAVTP